MTVHALYKPDSSADAILKAMDEEIAKVAKDGVDDATLKRVKTRMLADWNNKLESFVNRADTMAKLQVLWGDANVVNKIPGWIDGVTSSDIQRVVKTYLVPTNRTVIDRKPAAMIEAAKTAATSAPTTTAPAGANK